MSEDVILPLDDDVTVLDQPADTKYYTYPPPHDHHPADSHRDYDFWAERRITEDLKQFTNEQKDLIELKSKEIIKSDTEEKQETELERLYRAAKEQISDAEDRIKDQEKD